MKILILADDFPPRGQGGASAVAASVALVDALKAGEALEAGLALCQQELRQCAGLR
jgi:hypothetical protein